MARDVSMIASQIADYIEGRGAAGEHILYILSTGIDPAAHPRWRLIRIVVPAIAAALADPAARLELRRAFFPDDSLPPALPASALAPPPPAPAPRRAKRLHTWFDAPARRAPAPAAPPPVAAPPPPPAAPARPGRKRDAAKVSEVIEAHALGFSRKEIAELTGLAYQTVNKYIRSAAA